MSSPKRRRGGACDDTAIESISVDVLLEIVARLDTAAIIRFAATSKPIRRAILDPDLHRCLALRGETAAGSFKFNPALLLGLSCVYQDKTKSYVVSQVQRHRVCFDADRLLRSYDPIASRGCLVLLHRPSGANLAELRVVNSLTGEVSSPISCPGIPAVYPRTLLAVGEGGGSFQLLVAGRNLRMRVYSSEHGKWGDAVDPHLPPDFIHTTPNRDSPALVLGGTTVHWLCKDKGITALDVCAARATTIELPPKCFRWVKHVKHLDQGLLAASPDGKLGLIVAKPAAICMWTLSDGSSASGKRWSQQVLIRRHAIATWESGSLVRFLAFGERSGTVILQMQQMGLAEIIMGSGQALVLNDKLKEIGTCRRSQMQFCLHETDLPTLLKNMKPF
ncbi:hypothetical protein QOZ80_3AG0214030 [Eleusine coracana subsp. coracana]|nr:hypothetical protein QOZ80_3AG0214030 [Eleusine coracana subsp. coracana]